MINEISLGLCHNRKHQVTHRQKSRNSDRKLAIGCLSMLMQRSTTLAVGIGKPYQRASSSRLINSGFTAGQGMPEGLVYISKKRCISSVGDQILCSAPFSSFNPLNSISVFKDQSLGEHDLYRIRRDRVTYGMVRHP